MKKFFILIFLLILINSFSLKIRAGTYSNIPVSFEENDGKIVGIFSEILNYIAKKEGWNIEYTLLPQNIQMKRLLDGKIDLSFAYGITEERKKFYEYNKVFVMNDWATVYTNLSDKDLNYFSMQNKKVGVMKTDIYYDGPVGIKNILKNFEVKCNFVEYDTYEDIFKALEKKEINFGVVSRLYGVMSQKKYNVNATAMIFNPINLYFLFKKDAPINKKIIPILDKYLFELKNKNDSFYYKIINKYIESTVSNKIPIWIYYIFGFILSVIIILIITVYFMKKIINKKTKDALKQKEEVEAAYEELQAYNEELTANQSELEDLYEFSEKEKEKFKKLLEINSKIPQYINLNDSVFISELLNVSIKILDGNYGIAFKLDNDCLYFLSAFGHEINNFKDLKLKNFFNRLEITKLKNIKRMIKENTPQENKDKINGYILETEYSIIIPFVIEGKTNFIITIDKIKGDFEKDFLEISRALRGFIETLLKVKSQNQEFRSSYTNFANRLAMIAEAHDDITGNHINRVGVLSEFIAQKLNLSNDLIFEIKNFAPLHDVGKIFIPNDILGKKGPLTKDEWEIMKKHTVYARRLLGKNKYFQTALNIALYHHEKYNGNGYPFGIQGEEIPIEAAIVSVVDVYDALRSKRPYKKEMKHEEAMKIIFEGDERTNPSDFNPKILRIFEENSDEIKIIYNYLLKNK
ncbi:hypothetical protein OSSY52_04680 [Tepiditoga spiralis]|uniref:HD-GYP domain-containing protein n=1 Tax=Tepiditoga spiralis TaxID=2108365 RepID=A0A7G1G653_9BACT|nr:HD domain-containing phosphohydrolase [Tepiditoga spiralis]BBE30327.1 hypothetical protein OSSY52_04680 [Tepiditoga spiralis]